MEIAQRIVALRERRGWSQKRLAAVMGCDISALSRCERGIAVPRALTLLRLAAALGVSTDLLLTGREQRAGGRTLRAELADRLAALEHLPPEPFAALLQLLDGVLASFAPRGAAAGEAPAPAGRGTR